MIAKVRRKYPIQIVCEILACSLSTLLTYYYECQEEIGHEHLLTEIETIVMRRPYYGYRRVTQQLKHIGFKVGEIRDRRLLRHFEHRCKVSKVCISNTGQQSRSYSLS